MAQAGQPIRQANSKPSRAGKTKTTPQVARGKFVEFQSGADVTIVPVSKTRFKRIATERVTLGKLIAGYADTAAKAERTGQTFLVTYVVTPDGKAAAISETSSEKASKPLNAAVARAKARGAIKVSDILKGADMLTARNFGRLIGASHETVNAKRKRAEILGLEGATRGVKYPNWQVTNDGLPLPGLARLFGALDKQPWTVFRFLLTKHAELGDRTALDALKAGKVDAVIGVAENSAAGAFS